MLGLRRYKNIQIDLWQGDITTFATDLAVAAPEVDPALEARPAALIEKDFRAIFAAADRGLKRHISISVLCPGADLAGVTAFNAVKDFIDLAPPKILRRVTLVASDEKSYDILQRHLFARFPDELDEKGY